MVGPGRLELPTPRLSSVCSNQLSYGPIRAERLANEDNYRQLKRQTLVANNHLRLSGLSSSSGAKHAPSNGSFLFEERET